MTNKGGRPPIAKKKLRSLRVTVPMNAAERARCRREAKAAGMALSPWARMTLLNASADA